MARIFNLFRWKSKRRFARDVLADLNMALRAKNPNVKDAHIRQAMQSIREYMN